MERFNDLDLGWLQVLSALVVGVVLLPLRLIRLIVALLLHWKGQRLAFLVRWSLILCAFFQTVTSVAYFITPAWEWGVQLGVTGVFGVYAGLSRHPDFLIANSFVGLFNLLGLLGRLAWFTYTVPLYSIFEDQAYTPCIQWFDLEQWTDSPLCFQYTTAVRFLSYLVIFIAAKQTLVSYFLAKVPPAEETYEHVGVVNDKEPYVRY